MANITLSNSIRNELIQNTEEEINQLEVYLEGLFEDLNEYAQTLSFEAKTIERIHLDSKGFNLSSHIDFLYETKQRIIKTEKQLVELKSSLATLRNENTIQINRVGE